MLLIPLAPIGSIITSIFPMPLRFCELAMGRKRRLEIGRLSSHQARTKARWWNVSRISLPTLRCLVVPGLPLESSFHMCATLNSIFLFLSIFPHCQRWCSAWWTMIVFPLIFAFAGGEFSIWALPCEVTIDQTTIMASCDWLTRGLKQFVQFLAGR